jgi:hypothetical protein
MVTHPGGKTRAEISGKYPQGENRGKKTGHNNSNLALQDISMESSGMGTISNDGSHLCYK